MKNYPLWFWISILFVFTGEALFVLFGHRLFEEPLSFFQAALAVTFLVHPLYMVVTLVVLWQQKQDVLFLIKAGLVMLLPIWLAWFLNLTVSDMG